MYLKRKVDDFLEKWFNRRPHNSLIIKGARQIGKTYSILEFGKKNYDSLIYINFSEEPKYKNITASSYKPDDVIKEITLLNRDFNFIENKTLIFFDEIQEHIDIMSTLKFFTQDGKYDVICSGSMLGITYNKVSHIGVGYYDVYDMNGLDFEEFLWANKISPEQINDLKINLLNITPLSNTQHEVFSELFYQYTILGSYPKVVSDFLDNNYTNTQNIQKMIISNLKDDILKYADGINKFKLLEVFNAIPIFLARENKSFSYNFFNKKGKYFEGIFNWLSEAGIVNICKRINKLEKPLAGFSKEAGFKLYQGDTALLILSLGNGDADEIFELKNFKIYKGGIFENLIGSFLKMQEIPLYYFKNEKGTLEVDFVASSKFGIIPIEVKATSNKSKSLKEIIKNKGKYPDIPYAIKLTEQNIFLNDKILHIPHYLAFMIKEIIKSDTLLDKINKY